VADDRPVTMESQTEERESSDNASNIRMQRNPSEVGAPISQIHQLRLCKIRVVLVKGTDDE